MVRVKSDAYTKAAVKAPRKQSILKRDSSKTPKDGKSNKYAGGNSYCLRSTPAWQKPITSFFPKNSSLDDATNADISKMDVAACSSASSSEPVPCCSKEGSEPVPCCSKEDSEPVPCCSKEDSEPVPCCSKDSELFETEENPDSNVDADDE